MTEDGEVLESGNSPITLEEYADFVSQMMSKDSTCDMKAMMATAALGLTGEAGEVADIIKKVLFHKMPFTEEVRQKLVKEAGDAMFYLTFLCRFVLEVPVQEIIDGNVTKLSARYKTGTFTAEEFLAKEAKKAE